MLARQQLGRGQVQAGPSGEIAQQGDNGRIPDALEWLYRRDLHIVRWVGDGFFIRTQKSKQPKKVTSKR